METNLMSPPSTYLFLSIFLVVAIVFPLVPIGLAKLWSHTFTPAKPGHEKQSSYECGVVPVGSTRIQFKSQYYLYGIIFLIFDVEAVFLIPLAVAFLDLSLGAVLAVAVFILLLLEGLAWAWTKGVLKWQ